MKNVFKVSLLAAAVAFTVGCNAKDEPATTAQTQEAAAVTFKSDNDKAAYAIGASFSRYVETTLDKQAEFGMELDKEVILEGISDTLRGKSKLTDEDTIQTLKAYDARVQEAAQKAQQEAAEKAAADAKAFLDKNAKAEGVTVTESGLQYSVITKAEGPKPSADDLVTVHYVGTLIDGTEFDSSISRGEPVQFPLNGVIPGWTEGVQLMSVGEKYKFVIPADLAYGEKGAGPIPPGATLIFEVELLAIDSQDAKDAPATK
ncbi:FKBP-type peptidyl-prolyl cis-trans isomerase [Psychromonas sp. RZ22]|uniref:FKBP-type peptidyl-prolyl cis-trans isomerase n=1 Tax=Psychromonas algarum TaxID=2555643 RepID=UPI0010687390|nr:FKBP-type peptidyl-prolyl cis-trans isomerase [Psychromonas sp. RZ22]TEW54605.1 FKBP-type peptidyl-prolyl cis-trans isomerase [Psychromonas sp. RZ22]